MAFPTGTFSSPYAGRLLVSYTAKFSASSYHDAGFPSSAPDLNFAIRGYAGPAGSPSYTQVLDKYSLMAEIELDYPGGSVGWPVGIEDVAHLTPGISSVTMSELRVSCKLIKR
jgi:hypothetical protein